MEECDYDKGLFAGIRGSGTGDPAGAYGYGGGKKAGRFYRYGEGWLRLAVDGDDLYAEDTSLGGDDGIAVAYAMALLDSGDIPHPRLEVILTVDEEVGMDGARELDVSMLKGKRMLNLDSEEEGILLAGCAGGARVDWTLPVGREEKSGKRCRISVKGLMGGHSGAEIDKERGNANVLMGRLLYRLHKSMAIYVEALEGGLADNAIPREATVVLLAEAECGDVIRDTVLAVEKEFRQELQTKDPGVCIEIEELGDGRSNCLGREETDGLISSVCRAKRRTGDERRRQRAGGDLFKYGDCRFEGGSSGCAVFREKFAGRGKTCIDRKAGKYSGYGRGCAGSQGDYPGWAYRKESPFRDMAVKAFCDLYGKEPEIQAIHAGLECGILSSKIPDLECISIGPDMKNIHTTEERLSISSTERVWNYVLEILKRKE